MNTFEALRNYFTEDGDALVECARELNSYDGSFDYVNTFDFDEVYDMLDKEELARAIIYGEVSNMVDPVRFNGYGNLETVSEWDILSECEADMEYIIKAVIDNADSIWLPSEVEDILEEEEEEEDEEDEEDEDEEEDED